MNDRLSVELNPEQPQGKVFTSIIANKHRTVIVSLTSSPSDSSQDSSSSSSSVSSTSLDPKTSSTETKSKTATTTIATTTATPNTAVGFIKAIESGSKHLLIKRFTLRYPEQKLKFVGDGYQFDPKRAVGIAGLRGRHILNHDKCTGCQLCAITCEGIAEAIGMVKVDEQWKHNKKAIMPQIDYGKCVFCGLCVDACPFYALFMTNDYELSSFTKEHLIYTPAQLAIKPKYSGDVEIKIDDHGASHHA